MTRPAHQHQSQADRELLARSLITAGIVHAKKNGRPVDTDTARILAAALHTGPGTALQQFAATGHLPHRQALRELQTARAGLRPANEPGDGAAERNLHERGTWIAALCAHILATRTNGQDDHQEAGQPTTGAPTRPTSRRASGVTAAKQKPAESRSETT